MIGDKFAQTTQEVNILENRKQRIVEAAVTLFNMKGYSGTSVRDIAAEAGVNVALISYYFSGKQGLLEFLMMSFFEGYTAEIESAYEELDKMSARESLLVIIRRVLDFQQKNVQLARFVHREVTLDSTLIRELMTTYLMKEKYVYERVFTAGIKQKEFHSHPVDLLVLQFRELMLMPYLHPQYIREVYHLMPQEHYFKKRYARYLQHWVDTYVCCDRDSREEHEAAGKMKLAEGQGT